MLQKSDDQFEQYLRQFQPNRPRPLPEAERAGSSAARWPLAIAALIIAAIGLAIWKGFDPDNLRSSLLTHRPAPASGERGANSPGPVTIGRFNELMRRDPANLDAQLAEASRHLLPDVESPGGALHFLTRE